MAKSVKHGDSIAVGLPDRLCSTHVSLRINPVSDSRNSCVDRRVLHNYTRLDPDDSRALDGDPTVRSDCRYTHTWPKRAGAGLSTPLLLVSAIGSGLTGVWTVRGVRDQTGYLPTAAGNAR